MKLYLFFLLFFLSSLASAQETSKFRLGLQSGNNLSPSSLDGFEHVDGEMLLRYSLGLVVKQDLNKRVEVRWGGLKNHLDFYLHYGLNFVAKGYDYSIGQFSTFSDEFAIEVPFMLFIKAGNNVITRAWDRKKINTYTALGVKWSYSPEKRINRTLGEVDGELIEEETVIGGNNVLFHSNYGVMKTSKSGAITGLGIGVNIGLIATTKGQWNFTNGNVNRTENFSRKGTYFSLDLHHFFGKKKRINWKKLNRDPVLFCPHL